MIAFHIPHSTAAELDLCPLLRAAHLTLEYAIENDGIELTKTAAFKRVFVHWAAEHFRWPHMGYDELFRYNKVLNEYEFPPLEVTHYLLKATKLGRHYRGRFRATKQGAALANDRAQLFGELIPYYLFRIDHSSYSRFGEHAVGNWDSWLNVINVEADHGVDERDLFKSIYGYETSWGDGTWREAAAFTSGVLKPLEWAGFLDHITSKDAEGHTQRHYVKTNLWRSTLKLDTDRQLVSVQRH